MQGSPGQNKKTKWKKKKIKSCIIGYYTNNKDTNPRVMKQLAENRSAARRTTKCIILEGKNKIRQTKRQIQALERHEKVLV